MSFYNENQNPLPNIVELNSRLVPGSSGENECALMAELRIHPNEIEEEIGTITIEIEEATLSAEFHGLEVIPNSKLFDHQQLAVISQDIDSETTTTDLNESENAQSGGVEANLSPIKAGISMDIKSQKSKKTGSSTALTVRQSSTSKFVVVKAVGNNNWQIQKPKKGKLDGRYLGDEALCKLNTVKGTNRVVSQLELVVKQRHLKVEMFSEDAGKPGFLSRFSNNQKKIMGVVIAKSLHKIGSDKQYTGSVIFARSECGPNPESGEDER